MKEDMLKELILDNSNLIYSIIHKFRSKDIDDLFQVGCIGLIKAYQKFDNNQNVKFTSYAYNYIVGEIYQHIINNHNIHMSPGNIKLLNRVNKTEEYLTNHLGRRPTTIELCSFLEIEPYKYEEIKNIFITENIDNLYDLTNKESITKEELMDLKDALSNLNDDEKRLIKARYYDNITQSNLAKLYHTNQVKISRKEKKILTKLKSNMSC